jgi:hypothetical protein
MKIERFWIVTMATWNSTVGDVVFERDVAGLELQLRGGLKALEIVALYAGPDAMEQATRHGIEIVKAAQVMVRAREWEPETIPAAVEKAEATFEPDADPGFVPATHEGPTGRHGGRREDCGFCNPEPEAIDFAAETSPEAKRRHDARRSYPKCPACSGPRKPATSKGSDVVFTCEDCGAIFGVVDKPAEYVKGWPILVDGEGTRYFDFLFNERRERTHGWADGEGRVVQFG